VSATSFNELRREGLDVQRWNLLNPEQSPREAYVSQCLNHAPGPVVAATDYMKIFADQNPAVHLQALRGTRHRRFRPLRLPAAVAQILRSRSLLRHRGALKALADEGSVPASTVAKAIKKYTIDPGKPNPLTV